MKFEEIVSIKRGDVIEYREEDFSMNYMVVNVTYGTVVCANMNNCSTSGRSEILRGSCFVEFEKEEFVKPIYQIKAVISDPIVSSDTTDAKATAEYMKEISSQMEKNAAMFKATVEELKKRRE